MVDGVQHDRETAFEMQIQWLAMSEIPVGAHRPVASRMVSRVGIEPTTDALKGRYSTTELPARNSHCTLRGMVSPYLDRCLDVILHATSGVSPEAATKRTGDRWSVVEIVEHLQRAFSGTAKGFERCIEKGTPLATSATLKQTLQAFVLIDLYRMLAQFETEGFAPFRGEWVSSHVYEGKVVRLMDFGAFVAILPGRDGLVHISQISEERVERVSDKLKEGDLVKVKVLEVDRQGRVRLSMRGVA